MSRYDDPRVPLPGSRGEHQAQQEYDTTHRALAFYDHQVLTYLNPLMQQFIAQQEMVFVASADAGGECDSSFRAGAPGFVHVLDEKTLALPEYRGNGVMATIGNIRENAHIGLMFIDFYRTTVGLHVNGKVRDMGSGELLARGGLSPELEEAASATGPLTALMWHVVEVEEAFIHCAKHIPHLQKLEKAIHWSTDDPVFKSGDAFHAKSGERPWLAASPPVES